MTTAQDRTTTLTTGSNQSGRRTVLRVGAWSARATFALAVAHAPAMVASGAATGPPRDPYWARRPLAMAALGAVMATATLTVAVHYLKLSLARPGRLEGDRVIGVFGYGVVLPLVRLLIGRVFVRGADDLPERAGTTGG